MVGRRKAAAAGLVLVAGLALVWLLLPSGPGAPAQAAAMDDAEPTEDEAFCVLSAASPAEEIVEDLPADANLPGSQDVCDELAHLVPGSASDTVHQAISEASGQAGLAE